MKPRPFGRYYLVRKLGTGGMATTYKAKLFSDHGFTKTLVLKLILPAHADNPEFVQMFIDEAKVAAQLTHPNVVSVFDFGEYDGTYFIAMEYVNGRTLHSTLQTLARTGRQLPIELAARIVADVARGLHHAHKRTDDAGNPLDIVHRDVSPSNILLSFEGEVKLADFGVAKARGNAHHTTDGSLKGKYAYMSPEQVQNAPLDGRSDLFALGAVLYEALTGKVLFRADNELATIQKILGPVTSPSSLRAEVSAELDAVVLRSLEQDPSSRTPSGLRLAHELALAIPELRSDAVATRLSKFLCRLFATEIEREREALRAERIFVEQALASGAGCGAMSASDSRSSMRWDIPTSTTSMTATRRDTPTLDTQDDTKSTGGGPASVTDGGGASDATTGSKTILIVDDAKTMREVIKVYLMGNDFTYLTADDGLEALQIVRKQRPDLIIADIRMPRMSGVEMCREIKTDPSLQNTPVVLVSSQREPEVRTSVTQVGADRFLAKPIQSDELAQIVRELLRSTAGSTTRLGGGPGSSKHPGSV